MAFERTNTEKEWVEPISLIDMIFILLAFFLVSSVVAIAPSKEHKMSVPTPESIPGYAQVLIQFVDGNNVLWIDETVQDYVDQAFKNPFIKDKQKYIWGEIDKYNYLSNNQFKTRLQGLIEEADANPSKNFFIQIRCPNELPYEQLFQIVVEFSSVRYGNIKYGFVGGIRDDLKQFKRVRKQNGQGFDFEIDL